jgi:hypothetical protein
MYVVHNSVGVGNRKLLYHTYVLANFAPLRELFVSRKAAKLAKVHDGGDGTFVPFWSTQC